MFALSDSSEICTGMAFADPGEIARSIALISEELGDRYEVNRFLGRGGFATVWEAFDRVEKLPVAVKKLDPKPSRSSDFFRELRAMARLNHVNVVRLVNFLEASGNRYLILEYCAGESLRLALSRMRKRNQPWPVERIVDIVQQLAKGLSAAHDSGMTHRDLKPENILFSERIQDVSAKRSLVKLADFGLASGKDPLDDGQLRTVTGSPAYMSPEQFSGSYSPASDMYSLGIVAFEMVMGNVPFFGMPTELAYQHINQKPAFPSDLPAELSGWLPGLLAKKQSDRPTAKELVSQLDAFVEKTKKPNRTRVASPRETVTRSEPLELIGSYPCEANAIYSFDDGFLAAGPRATAIVKDHADKTTHSERDAVVAARGNRIVRKYSLDSTPHGQLRSWDQPIHAAAIGTDRLALWKSDLLSVQKIDGELLWDVPVKAGATPPKLAVLNDGQVAVSRLISRPEVVFLSGGAEQANVETPGIVSSLVPAGNSVVARTLTGKGFRAYRIQNDQRPRKLPGSEGLLGLTSTDDSVFGIWPNGQIVKWSGNRSIESDRISLGNGVVRGFAASATHLAILIGGSSTTVRVYRQPTSWRGEQ
ncbi:MAG: serine/threonine-protein kinase [Gemmataceae bacterium]